MQFHQFHGSYIYIRPINEFFYIIKQLFIINGLQSKWYWWHRRPIKLFANRAISFFIGGRCFHRQIEKNLKRPSQWHAQWWLPFPNLWSGQETLFWNQTPWCLKNCRQILWSWLHRWSHWNLPKNDFKFTFLQKLNRRTWLLWTRSLVLRMAHFQHIWWKTQGKPDQILTIRCNVFVL